MKKTTSHQAVSASEGRRKLLFLTQFAMILALEAIVCFTPLGSLPAVGPLVATLSGVPVVVAAVFMGTGAGAGMGFFFGLFSFIVWTFVPPSPVAFVFTPFYSVGSVSGNFWSLVICFVPRILIGVAAGLCVKLFKKLSKGRAMPLFGGIAGAIGSLVNTLLVCGGIYLFFGRSYAEAIGTSFELLLGIIGTTILTSGIPEAVICAVVAAALTPVKKVIDRYR